MESNRNFAIYTAVSIFLVLVVGIGGSFVMAVQSVPAEHMSEFWRLSIPDPMMATGELSLGLLVRGFAGFFLPGDSFRWSLAGPA